MRTVYKSIFQESDYHEIRQRVASLTPDAKRLWGSMSVAQMLAHCSVGAEMVLGLLPFVDKSTIFSRTVLRWVVMCMVRKGDLGKDQRTLGIFKIKSEKDFDIEKSKLLKYLDEMYYTGTRAKIGPHPYFGKFSNQEWGMLQYAHFDHHLRQFSA